jgi:hypothetical protein
LFEAHIGKSPYSERAYAKHIASAEVLILAVLAILLCVRVWGFGITHTDDAMWALWAHGPQPGNAESVDPVGRWATEQGRFWAYLSGTMMLHTLKWQGTAYAEILRLGSLLAFLVVSYLLVLAYCGRRLALLAATLFLAFFMLRWDGSIITTYPLITWVSGIAFGAALLAARKYVRSGHTWLLVAAAPLLFVALTNNEGITVLFAALSMMAAMANRRQLRPAGANVPGTAPGLLAWRVQVVFAGVCVAYAGTYLAWRFLHPTHYAGHALSLDQPFRALLAFAHFSTSGSVLHDLFSAYRVTYADVHRQIGEQTVYRIGAYLPDVVGRPGLVAIGIGVAWLAFRTLAGRDPEADPPGTYRVAIIAGALGATLHIVPVSLATMYQNWASDQGIRAYSHTVIAHMGLSLLLAGLLLQATRSPRLSHAAQRVAGVTLALVIGLLGSLAYRANEAIADDMRPEAGRWQILEHALVMNRELVRADAIVVPRFANGSWYTVVEPSYWTLYTRSRHRDNTHVVTKASDVPASARSRAMLDYAFDLQHRSWVGLIAAPGGPARDARAQLIVFTDSGSDDALAGMVLSYDDDRGKPVTRPLARGDVTHRIGGMQVALLPYPAAGKVRLSGPIAGPVKASPCEVSLPP